MALVSAVSSFCRTRASGKGQIVRLLAADGRRSFWALADQGVASFGSFGLNILLGRAFTAMHQVGYFGDYWTLMELMIFLNGLQGALIIYPMTVRAAGSDCQTLSRMAGQSLLLTLLGWPLLASALLATAYVSRIPLAAGIWAAIALLLWQLQETTRRALMAHLHFRAAVFGDAISYVGQVMVVAALGRIGSLSLVTTFQVMAVTSALAAMIQAWQIRLRRGKPGDLPAYSKECWHLGRWMLAGNLTNFIIGPLFAWNLRYWLGDALMGVNYAISNLLRVTNPLGFAIASLIVPHAARASKEKGTGKAKREMFRFGGLGAMMLLPYLAFMVFAPRLAITLFYGSGSQEFLHFASVLRIAALGSALAYACIVTGSFLNGVQRSKFALGGQIVYAAAALGIVMPCVAMFGLIGAATGWFIAGGVLLAVNVHFITRVRDVPVAVHPELNPLRYTSRALGRAESIAPAV